MINKFQFDKIEIRQKYLKLVETDGLNKAVTALHNFVGELEPKIYEDGGYTPEKLDQVQFLRGLARELWAMRLNPEVKE